MKENEKTVDEILKQQYVTATDLMIIIPNLGYNRALNFINEMREEMQQKGYFVPNSKTKVALTKIFKKKFGL